MAAAYPDYLRKAGRHWAQTSFLGYPTCRSPVFVPVQLQVLISGPRRVRTPSHEDHHQPCLPFDLEIDLFLSNIEQHNSLVCTQE